MKTPVHHYFSSSAIMIQVSPSLHRTGVPCLDLWLMISVLMPWRHGWILYPYSYFCSLLACVLKSPSAPPSKCTQDPPCVSYSVEQVPAPALHPSSWLATLWSMEVKRTLKQAMPGHPWCVSGWLWTKGIDEIETDEAIDLQNMTLVNFLISCRVCRVSM